MRERDFQALFQLARRHGASQGWIASAIGMTQSEVSNIIDPSASRDPRRITNIDLIDARKRITQALSVLHAPGIDSTAGERETEGV